MTIFLTHAGEREALARAPFMSRPARSVIYEGVNLERFRPDPAAGRAFRERQGLGDGPSVLAVGALEREKRYARSEEHTSELQSPCNLVCRLLLEKKKKEYRTHHSTREQI